MKKIIELELHTAYEFATFGDVDRAIIHVDLAKKYLLEYANSIREQNESVELPTSGMRYWKNKKTGRVIGTDEQPSDEWEQITKAEYTQALEHGNR